MYSVKEVAKILNVSPHLIRYYDDWGLIPDVNRGASNQRLFSDSSLEWFFICITLRKTGLSMKEVKRYVDLYQKGDSTIHERLDLMLKQREKLLEEIKTLKIQLQLLNQKVDYYDKLLAGEKISWDHDFIQKMIWRKIDDFEKKFGS